jgi:hypothetical protein
MDGGGGDEAVKLALKSNRGMSRLRPAAPTPTRSPNSPPKFYYAKRRFPVTSKYFARRTF